MRQRHRRTRIAAAAQKARRGTIVQKSVAEPVAGPARRLAASALPQIRTEFRYWSGGALQFRESSGTGRDADGLYSFVTWLEWQPDGRKRYSSSPDPIVADGQLLIDDGRDRSLLASRVGRRATIYRQAVIASVSEMYVARAELIADRARFEGESLEARVEHEIRIQALEARLDVLTDGAVSRYVPADSAEQEDP